MTQNHSSAPLLTHYDAVIVGGGAAGLMCALTAAKRGKKILLSEISNKLGKKILMSGGGRCNFTNLEIEPSNFICKNPHFVKSALKQYSQWDFIAMVAEHNIPYHEKTLGQLFCDNSAKDILNMLLNECNKYGVEIFLTCDVERVVKHEIYSLYFEQFQVTSDKLVIASGGLSIPTLGGASGFGYRIAKQFGLQVNTTAAALVPFTLTGKWQDFAKALAGVSLPIVVTVPNMSFRENMLFTHRGISGPAILQVSTYWELGEAVEIDLLPDVDLGDWLQGQKQSNPKATVSSSLQQHLPKSVVQAFYPLWWRRDLTRERNLQEYKDVELLELGNRFNAWRITPSGTEGYRTAEVTKGGVDVASISSKTMQANGVSGLYFIGEVLDVTGHLGGFNFQWAWSSGYVAGINI